MAFGWLISGGDPNYLLPEGPGIYYFDLLGHDARKKWTKNIIPNGGQRLWFTIIQSNKNHLKHNSKIKDLP